MKTDATHDPALRSWVESANAPACDFPIQNLPYGRFRRRGGGEPWRIGVAIGDQILDLKQASQEAPWGETVYALLDPLAEGDLNAFMALGPRAWSATRQAISDALAQDSDQGPFLELCLVPQKQAEMSLPFRVGSYSDFFAGIHHALAAGRLFRPDDPLPPNYKWVPIGYHGRASSIALGGKVLRPLGQIRRGRGDPEYVPSERLDYELELGWIVGAANDLGKTVSLDEAEDRLFGAVLLNDWSARDVQVWESQPLGPFLSKSFATSISPWVVTMAALAPFRRPFVRPEGDPQPLPYLDSERNRDRGAVDITLEAWIRPPGSRQAFQLSHSNALDAYWTPAQLLAHHASNGCNLAIGDLLGSGTLSGPGPGQGGCLLELSKNGREPVELDGGATRSFLEDGDTVELRAYCQVPNAAGIGLGESPRAVRIGFGGLVGTVVGR